ncbi:MAG: hypothetical protein U0941_21240 [Planctomycetaceae bacterium]
MTEFDLTPISPQELRYIDERVSTLRNWYNNHSNVKRCEFAGDPSDLMTLTFISYELDIVWDWDAGETVACVWGNVLVQRFDFQWVRLKESKSARTFAVYNAMFPETICPWSRMNELITNGQYSHSVAEQLLVSFLAELHAKNAIPDGWHPVLDAIKKADPVFPKSIAAQIQTLIAKEPEWFRLLGLSPYEWNKSMTWETVALHLSLLIDAGRNRR